MWVSAATQQYNWEASTTYSDDDKRNGLAVIIICWTLIDADQELKSSANEHKIEELVAALPSKPIKPAATHN